MQTERTETKNNVLVIPLTNNFVEYKVLYSGSSRLRTRVREGWILKGHEKAFGGDGNVQNLDFSDCFMGKNMNQNSLSCAL